MAAQRRQTLKFEWLYPGFVNWLNLRVVGTVKHYGVMHELKE
jgi:hypothetical protein